MTPGARPIVVCRSGYDQLCDESGNRAQTGYLALARLPRCKSDEERKQITLALWSLVEWAVAFHARILPCALPCRRCEVARRIDDRKERAMPSRILMGILQVLVPQLLGLLTPDVIKAVIDRALDVIEDAVEATETNLDNATILPVCATIRAALNVPDDD